MKNGIVKFENEIVAIFRSVHTFTQCSNQFILLHSIPCRELVTVFKSVYTVDSTPCIGLVTVFKSVHTLTQ